MNARTNAIATIVAAAAACAAAAWAVYDRTGAPQRALTVGLVLYIVTFVLAKAVRIRRGGPLGRAMAAFNAVLAFALLWSLATREWPRLLAGGRAWVAIYAVLAVVVTVGWWELAKATRWPWQRWGDEGRG